jgi:hypothetical protein
LDKAFKEIYDQSSSPQAFFGVLQKRYEDADRIAKQYKMGFDNRKDLDEHPFWKAGAAGYIDDIKKSAPAKGKQGASAPVKVSTPDEATKLTPGTHYVTPDGKEFIR